MKSTKFQKNSNFKTGKNIINSVQTYDIIL